MIVVKQTEDSNLGEEASRSWKEILEQLYVFDILEKEVSCFTTIRHIVGHQSCHHY